MAILFNVPSPQSVSPSQVWAEDTRALASHVLCLKFVPIYRFSPRAQLVTTVRDAATMFAVSLSIDMYETKIINRKKSLKVQMFTIIYTAATLDTNIYFPTQIRPVGETHDCRWCDRSFSKVMSIIIIKIFLKIF